MNKIDIKCILDMSGSMYSIIEDARKGFNEYLKTQKESGNDINFSLMFFDTGFYIPYNNVDIDTVEYLNEKTYYPGGGTALYDALGISIDNYLDALGETPKSERYDKTLFVILTDGDENSSHKYNQTLIKRMVEDIRENFNAEFIYLGANQDACFVAESMGISGNNSYEYAATADGITTAYAKASDATVYYSNNDVSENLFE